MIVLPMMMMLTGVPLLNCNPGTDSLMNVAELSAVHYSLKIARDPVITAQSKSYLTMVNKDGQKYTCSLPSDPDLSHEESKDETESDIDELLKPLESASCMLLTKDWWTYEVCYKKDIKQYHVEDDVPVGDVILLGIHNPGQDSMLDPNRTYHTQWYGNGSRCDLTGQKRQVEVRFVCKEGASEVYVGDILEQQSCEYRVMVYTDRLCGVARMRTASATTPLPIVCHPVLDQVQMDKYELYKEKTILARQLKQQQRRKEQSLELAYNNMEPRQRVKRVAAGVGTMDGMMEVMGDKIAEKILSEVDNLLEVSLGTPFEGKVKRKDVRQMSESSSFTEKLAPDPLGREPVISLASLKDLMEQRSVLKDIIVEAKKTLEQHITEMVDTENMLFHMEHTKENADSTAGLEMSWRSFELTISDLQVSIAKLESKAKSVSNEILMVKNKLMKEGSSVAHDVVEMAKAKPRNFVKQKIGRVVEDPNLPSMIYEQTETTTEVSAVTAADEGIDDLVEDFGGNIKISVHKMLNDEESEDDFDNIQTDKIVDKLEGLIGNKLTKHGLAASGKVVEVKIIATKLPDGADGDDDGVEQQLDSMVNTMMTGTEQQLDSMVNTMMTGNVEGYEAIDELRSDEKSYGFSWSEDKLKEVEAKILIIEQDGANADLVNEQFTTKKDADDIVAREVEISEKKDPIPQGGILDDDKIDNKRDELKINYSNSESANIIETIYDEEVNQNAEEMAGSLAELFGDMIAEFMHEKSTLEPSDDTEFIFYVDEENEEVDNESVELFFYTDEEKEEL